MSCFEFEFSCRILKSNFEFVFFVSSLYSTSRISIRICRRNFRCLALFDFSNFDSNLPSKFSLSCSIRLLEFRFESFVALFDFSNFVALFDFSNFVALFDFSKSIVKFDFSNFNFRFEFSIRFLDSSPLNFEFVLIYSTSRTLMIIKFSNLSSKLLFSCRILHLSS